MILSVSRVGAQSFSALDFPYVWDQKFMILCTWLSLGLGPVNEQVSKYVSLYVRKSSNKYICKYINNEINKWRSGLYRKVVF